MKKLLTCCLCCLLGMSCQHEARPILRIPMPASTVAYADTALVDFDPEAFPTAPNSKRVIQGLLTNYAGRAVLHLPNNEVDMVLFESGLAVDADGAPNAYHPDDRGLDALSNAGHEGNWWALATNNGLPSGEPLIQTNQDPAPGYYVSMTSLSAPHLDDNNPKKYVDASQVAYFVLPSTLRIRAKMALGDAGAIYYKRTGKLVYAIFADSGPEGKLGEGSIALAKALGINSNPRTGGVPGGVVYLLFPNSGNGLPMSQASIDNKGKSYFQKWGGKSRLEDLLKKQDEQPKTVIVAN